MKPKYRYNWNTGEWSEVFRINTDIVVISPFVRPDGSHNSFTIPRESPLAEYYLRGGI